MCHLFYLLAASWEHKFGISPGLNLGYLFWCKIPVGICASLQSVTHKCLRFYPSVVHVTMATVAGLKHNFMWVGTSRYLENSGCVGMCVNMCKIPTQDFFTNDFGLPLTMTPSKSYDFDRLCCIMSYICCNFNWDIVNRLEWGVACNDTKDEGKCCADFDDMSCEMVYGQKPLPLEEDTALKQPCYASLCKFSGGTYSHPDANPLNHN